MSIFVNTVSLDSWETFERERILNLFLEHEYGFCLIPKDDIITYSIVFEQYIDEMIFQKVEMEYKSHKMYFGLFLPKQYITPFKTFVLLVHPYAERNGSFFDNYKTIESFCPVKEITKRGFAVAMLSAKTVAEDNVDGKDSGIFKCCNKPLTDNSWGVISAWAWGCSKVMDYLLTRPEIASDKVAVIGHSRGGKTALLAGALDKRFSLIISNDSGNSGAALSRGHSGETIENITNVFPYWFCNNYKKYANNENALPFDQHMLIALQAPRHCYIASANNDSWADPGGELLSAKLASQYYHMYGVDGLVIPNDIDLNVSYDTGYIAYHRREGEHALTLFDWEKYMDYFDKISK